MKFKDTSGLKDHARENRRGGRSRFRYAPKRVKITAGERRRNPEETIGGEANSMKLETYEIQLGDHWHTVRGYVNPKGWLEWKDKDGAQGLKRPGTFRRKEKRKP